jgi:GrpB protein
VALDPVHRRDVSEIRRRMEADGYRYRGDHGPDGGLLFVRGAGEVRTVHVHMVGLDDPEWTRYLAIS